MIYYEPITFVAFEAHIGTQTTVWATQKVYTNNCAYVYWANGLDRSF